MDLGVSLARGSRAYRRSNRYIRECERRGRDTRLAGESRPVCVLTGAAPLVALTGIFRPRLLISQLVIRALSAEQLAAVLRHERAHRMSLDNLKRLLILLSPGLLPFFRGFDALEQAWAVAAEWAADDRATKGNRRWALTLASALVRVARLNTAQPFPLLATSLLGDQAGLSARVDRLLNPAPRRQEIQASPILKATAGLTLAAGIAGVMLQPTMLHSVHELLEDLIR
jgi:beta-lactamase regulating signal transducer with metallopeptidase domain